LVLVEVSKGGEANHIQASSLHGLWRTSKHERKVLRPKMRGRVQEGVEKENIHISGNAGSLSGAASYPDVPKAFSIASQNHPFFEWI